MSEIAKPIGVSVEETTRLTSLGRTTVWKMIKEGKLKTVRFGSRTVVLYESVENLFPHSLPHSVTNSGGFGQTEADDPLAEERKKLADLRQKRKALHRSRTDR